MQKQLLSFSEFKEILGDGVLEQYSSCITNAIEDQKALVQFNSSLDCFVELDKTTKAKFTHNRITGRLMESFKEHPNVRVDKVRQLITVNVDDKVIIRQKKFRGKGRVSSQQTKQHKNYLGQLEIEGLPVSATYIIGGYLLDRTGTNNLGVYFACYNGTQLEWFTKLGEYVHEQAKFNFPEENEQIQTETKLVKVKKRLTQLKIVAQNDDIKTVNEKK